MAANVVPIHRGKKRHLVLSLDQLVGFEGVKILSGLLQEYFAEDKTRLLKDFARKANLCPATVSKIQHYETKSPRMLTCIMIFKALGFSAVRFD